MKTKTILLLTQLLVCQFCMADSTSINRLYAEIDTLKSLASNSLYVIKDLDGQDSISISLDTIRSTIFYKRIYGKNHDTAFEAYLENDSLISFGYFLFPREYITERGFPIYLCNYNKVAGEIMERRYYNSNRMNFICITSINKKSKKGTKIKYEIDWVSKIIKGKRKESHEFGIGYYFNHSGFGI